MISKYWLTQKVYPLRQRFGLVLRPQTLRRRPGGHEIFDPKMPKQFKRILSVIYGAKLVNIILPIAGIFWNSKLDQNDWVMAKNKCQYRGLCTEIGHFRHISWPNTNIFERNQFYTIITTDFAHFVHFIAGNILKLLFKATNTSKKGQNYDYLRLKVFFQCASLKALLLPHFSNSCAQILRIYP